MSHIFFIFILFIFISNITTRREFRRGRSSGELKTFATCFDRLGCIDTNEKWYDSYYRPVNLEPLDRHTIRTEFLFMKAENNSKEILYDILTLKIETVGIAGFRKSTRTFFLIHDFTSNGHTGWIKHMAIAIAEEMDSNVIAVDWEAGAEPPFDQAISNARIVALEMEVFIKMLMENCGITTDKIHLIGHGVGAHIAGYVGKVMKNIDRITALDPTGPRFENMPNLVRLDPDDAKYVEVLHTEAFNHRSQGTLQPMGHSDFYINNAGHQPGCNETGNSPKITDVTRSELREGKILSACSHKRAFKYYINAITTRECKFVGIACSSYEAFLNGSCSDCENNKCASFDMCPPPKNVYKTRFFLNTHTDAPFCTHAYQVNISIEQNENSKKVDGYFEFILIDTNNKITFATGSDFGNTKRTYVPGETYTLIVYAPPPAINDMKEAKVRWRASTAFPFPKKPIYVKYISVRRIPMMGERVPINGLCPESNTEIRDSAYVQFIYCNVAKVQEAQRIAAMTTMTGVKTSSTTRTGTAATTTGSTTISNTTWPLPNATTTTHKPPTQCMFPAGATTAGPPLQGQVETRTTGMPKTEEHIQVTSPSMSGSRQPETSIPTTPEGLTNKVFFDEERNKTYVGPVSANITTVSVEVEDEEEEEKAHVTTASTVTQTESVLQEEQLEGIETEVGIPTTTFTDVETEEIVTVSPISTAGIPILSASTLKIEPTMQEVTTEGSTPLIKVETTQGSSTELPIFTTEEQVISETTVQHSEATLSSAISSTSVEISIATVSEITEGNFPQLTKENGTNVLESEFRAKPQFGQGQQSEGYASFTLGGGSTESEGSSTVTMLGTRPEVSSSGMLETETEGGGATPMIGTQPEEGASSSILEYESKGSSTLALLGTGSEEGGMLEMLETHPEEGSSTSILESQSEVSSATSLLGAESEEAGTAPKLQTQPEEGVSSSVSESQSKASSATSLFHTGLEEGGATPMFGTQPEEVVSTSTLESQSKASSATSLLQTELEEGGATPIRGTQPEEVVSSSVSEYQSKASNAASLLGTEPEAGGTAPILGSQPEEGSSTSILENKSETSVVTSIPETQAQEGVTVPKLGTQSEESSATLIPATQSETSSTILIPQIQSEGSTPSAILGTNSEASEQIALGTSEIETMIAEELTTARTQLEQGTVITALEETTLAETITPITEVAEEAVVTTTGEGYGTVPQLINENDTVKEEFKSQQAGQGQRSEGYESFTLSDSTTECTEWYMTEVDTETVEELTHVIAFTGGMGEGISIKAGNVEKPTSEVNTYQTTAAGEISQEIQTGSGSNQSAPNYGRAKGTEVAEEVTAHFGLSTQTGKKNQTEYVTVVVEEIIEEVTESASITTGLSEEIKEPTTGSASRMLTTISSTKIAKASLGFEASTSTFEEEARTGPPTPIITEIVASETITTSFPEGGKQAGQESVAGGESGNQRILGQNKGMLELSTQEGGQTGVSTEAAEIARLPTEPEEETTTTTSTSRKTTTARGTTTTSRLTTTRKGKSRKSTTKSTTKSKNTSPRQEEDKSAGPTTECTTEELPECDEIEE